MIMVTGGSGNIGRRVLARLSESHDVLNVDRIGPGDAWRGRTEIVELTDGGSETFYLTAREHYGTLDTVEMVRRNWGNDVPVDHAYYADNPRGSLFDLRKAGSMLGWQPEWSVERVMAEHG